MSSSPARRSGARIPTQSPCDVCRTTTISVSGIDASTLGGLTGSSGKDFLADLAASGKIGELDGFGLAVIDVHRPWPWQRHLGITLRSSTRHLTSGKRGAPRMNQTVLKTALGS